VVAPDASHHGTLRYFNNANFVFGDINFFLAVIHVNVTAEDEVIERR
jgi:hypothetical protein